MKYENIYQGVFVNRPNRFIAYVDIDGCRETVHVKNTGRCRELLIPEAVVYVQGSLKPGRKTRWDLIAVKKNKRIINMDSQIPNKVVKEWLEDGNLIENITTVRPEYTYGSSRIDLYVEAGERKILIEVKGVTLEADGVVRFPDAPSERAVKHVYELKEALKKGYEAYVFFVIQMRDVRYFTPNTDTHPEFAKALAEAAKEGVRVVAYDCLVEKDSISIHKEVPVVLENPVWQELAGLLIPWYQRHKRELPWRENPKAYNVWVSEIMLQQTRVEAVKPYYARFMKELPTIKDLSEAREDQLLKLWEGLGYYSRARNLKKAAQILVRDYDGRMPSSYEQLIKLPGIGSYTAGAIASIAFGEPVPAVDGNVLRVLSRVLASQEDILKQSVKRKMEKLLTETMPADHAGAFNEGLMELGETVCVPGGPPKCGICPLGKLCLAFQQDLTSRIPVKSPAKNRRKEEKTVCILKGLESMCCFCRGPGFSCQHPHQVIHNRQQPRPRESNNRPWPPWAPALV